MANLLCLLESLNRKERYFLIGDALGNQNFSLGKKFRQKVKQATNIDVPENEWVAMDYHLDWLAAAIHVTQKSIDPRIPWANENVVNGTQEDTDLIVGFEDGEETILILVEAKADTAWSNTQMNSKIERYIGIFGSDGKRSRDVTPVLLLTSPERPQKLRTDEWPSWALIDNSPIWMELNMAPNRLRLLRCDNSGGSDRNGGYAKIH